MADVSITVTDSDGVTGEVSLPTEMGLNLMEALKAHGYPIMATCGGMALCGTCHIVVTGGLELLPEAAEAEAAMLDSLPMPEGSSRLACQLRISESMEGLKLRLAPQE